jgi:hypothetical protein
MNCPLQKRENLTMDLEIQQQCLCSALGSRLALGRQSHIILRC